MTIEREAAVAAERGAVGRARSKEPSGSQAGRFAAVRQGAGPRLAGALEAGAGVLLGALLVWAPLPYGSNRPWSWSLLAAGIGLVLVIEGSARAAGAERRLPWIAWPAAVATAVVWAWAWVQT